MIIWWLVCTGARQISHGDLCLQVSPGFPARITKIKLSKPLIVNNIRDVEFTANIAAPQHFWGHCGQRFNAPKAAKTLFLCNISTW